MTYEEMPTEDLESWLVHYKNEVYEIIDELSKRGTGPKKMVVDLIVE